MSIKLEVVDDGQLYIGEMPPPRRPPPIQETRPPKKRGRPRKKKQEDNWGMASGGGQARGGNGGGGDTVTAGPTPITVVPQAQLLQVELSVTPTTVQMSPESSADSSHSITITSHPNVQVKGDPEQVLSSPGNSCDEAPSSAGALQGGGGDSAGSPVEVGHFITVTGGDPTSYTSLTTVNPTVGAEGGGPRSYTALTTVDGGVVASDAGSDEVTHSYVQYVEGAGEQTIYTTSNGQMYPVYTVGESGTMYTSTSGQYYSPGNTTPVTYTQGQLIGNTAYLIQQGVDSEHAIIGTRTSPQTVAAVQWLLENYETSEGVSLPRSTLYNHYLRHCYENKLDPVNAASFGKLIRSVFLGLRTRRLGTRGNSKYHYYGIRVKAGSVLMQLMSEEMNWTVGSGGTGGGSGSGGGGGGRGWSGGNGGGTGSVGGTSTGGAKRLKLSCGTTKQEPGDGTPTATPIQVQNQEFLGDGSGAIPEFPEIELPTGCPLPALCSLEDIDTFRSIYREHCEAFLDAIINLEFATIESLWREFWWCQDNNNGDECEEEKYFSKTKLLSLCKFLPVQEFVKRVDFQFYQNLVQVLIPDVLRPIPSSLTQAIRNFAKGLESWLTSAMQGCPQDMVDIKVSAVCAFAQTLRRYTSLNHLAQAARAVLQNSVQINQMLTDLNRVDFHNVQEQASWVCQCDGGLVARLEADFKSTLQQQNSLEQWAAWLKAVVNSVLKPYHGRPNFTTAARQLLLKWSFYSSMVIRDLTLRSAASFGSFHLIRLLYDEYMFYLIEHQVAMVTGETPIAVMGEKPSTSGLEYGGIVDMINGGGSDGRGMGIDQEVQQEQVTTGSEVKRLKMS